MIGELSEQTGVSIKQITKFIREGRISMVNAPNLSYPCESCGTLIRENHICDDCRVRLTKDTNTMKRNEASKAAEQKPASAQAAYRGISQYKDR
jgi:ribosomal protein L32